jgi:hypothetical protein
LAEENISVETTFGLNAGRVWQALSKLGTATPLMIRNETKLASEDVYGALGWLAREGKLSQMKDGKLVKFKIIE